MSVINGLDVLACVLKEVDRAIRDRLAGLDADEMPPSHLLERYLIAKGRSEEELAPILDVAQRIFSDEYEENPGT